MPETASIPTRRLGRNGPLVPALGFGLMGLTHDTYGATPSEEEAFAILDRAYDLYGDVETLLGRCFKRTGRRNEISLATKFGFVTGSKRYEVDSSYEYCKKACAESLRVLGVDRIDLYYVHSVNPATPLEETIRAMVELQAQGKITHIGLSAISSRTLLRASAIPTITCVQTDYSPFALSIENSTGTNLLRTCRSVGVGVVAAMPLGRGMITSTFAADDAVGDATDKRPLGMPRFMAENRKANVEVVGRLQAFADRKGVSTAQLALAWLLAQGEDVIPIPGTKRMEYLEENWAALDVQLSEAEVKDIRQFLEGTGIQGDTLPAAFKGYGFRDTVEEKA